MKKKILIVEDSQDMRLVYKRMFRKQEKIELAEAETGEAAWELLPIFRPDLSIVDISLPGMSGLDFIEKSREQYPAVKLLVVTGHEVSRYYDDAIRRGADDLISKNIGKGLVDKCLQMLGSG